MRKTFAFILLLFFCAGEMLRAQNAQPSTTPMGTPANAADPKIYGEYPLAYQEIIKHWMDERLIDPESAAYEWTSEPTPGETTQKGQRLVGYFVDFKVTARNKFGGRTPKQRYRVLLRNGVVFWATQPR